MKQSVVKFDMSGMDDFKQKMGNSYITRVGILGDKDARTEGDTSLGNADIGLKQILGSVSEHIPPRDFLMMPLRLRSNEFVNALGNPTIKAAFDAGDYKRVYELMGVKAEQFIGEAFETAGYGQWPPNSPRTIKKKGSAAPLIDTSQLRRSIISDVVKKGATESGAAAFEGAA